MKKLIFIALAAAFGVIPVGAEQSVGTAQRDNPEIANTSFRVYYGRPYRYYRYNRYPRYYRYNDGYYYRNSPRYYRHRYYYYDNDPYYYYDSGGGVRLRFSL